MTSRARSSLPVAFVLAGLVALGSSSQGGEPGILHEDMNFEHDGVTRTFHFYEAPGHEGDDRPLVFLLHGGGGRIDNHIGIGRTRWPHQLWLDIAEQDRLHLVVPQGIRSHWNDCRADCRHCGDQDDIGFLTSLLDDLAGGYGVDLTRIYVVGESNGGIMTLRLAQERPELFAGMGVVIAQMPQDNECDPVSELPISIMFQLGTADKAVPYAGGRSLNPPSGSFLSASDTLAYWVDHNQCEPTPSSTELPEGSPAEGSTAWREDWECPETGTKLAAIHLEGGGHVPPSREVKVSRFWERLVGAQNHDVESATSFWDFLRTERRMRE